jgi:RNA polymerase sigma factor (sigma-70 family)
MESSTRAKYLDHRGKPLPDHIQHTLDELVPRLRRKFSMIRDDVVVTEILEQAGQQITRHEERQGHIEHLYGFAWVTVRNVTISRLRRSPHLLEHSTLDSELSASAISRLIAEQSNPSDIEYQILLAEVLGRLSPRERRIAISKKAGFSSREIADHLGMTVSPVDTAVCRTRRKVERLLRQGRIRDNQKGEGLL